MRQARWLLEKFPKTFEERLPDYARARGAVLLEEATPGTIQSFSMQSMHRSDQDASPFTPNTKVPEGRLLAFSYAWLPWSATRALDRQGRRLTRLQPTLSGTAPFLQVNPPQRGTPAPSIFMANLLPGKPIGMEGDKQAMVKALAKELEETSQRRATPNQDPSLWCQTAGKFPSSSRRRSQTLG